MKKNFLFIVVLFLIGFLFLNDISSVFAGGNRSIFDQNEIDVQEQGLRPSICCQIRHKITIRSAGGGTKYYEAGYILRKPGTRSNDCDIPGGFTQIETPYWAGACTLDGVMTLAEWLLWIGIIVVGVTVIIAGITFATSSGSSEKVDKAKKTLIWGIVGIFIILGSQIIPGIVRYFIGI